MLRHGVYVTEQATAVSTPVTAASGIPFVIDTAPIQRAVNPAPAGVPVLCTSWGEAVDKLGYSDDWDKYGLCEFMYSHFKLYNSSPVIFCNLLDPASMITSEPAADMAVLAKRVTLPPEAINDASLTVMEEGGMGSTYVRDEDYAAYYTDDGLVIEVLEGGAAFEAGALNVAYRAVDPARVTEETAAMGMEAIEMCLSAVGIVPDTICSPNFGGGSTMGAVMAAKASGINGIFRAKALVDIPTDEVWGAASYGDVGAAKNRLNFTDENQIVCWPMVKLGERTFHLSTQLAGILSSTDTANGGCPVESPDNKKLQCNAIVRADGTEVLLTLPQANILNAAGVYTALGFIGGLVGWGNYTACYPANTDVKDQFIPISRMFDWLGNSEILTFWSKVGKPMNDRLVYTVLDTVNIWLNGLVGQGYLLGARAELIEDENPRTDLMAGIFRIHNYVTPPGPAQEINFITEYDVSYLTSALQG